MKRAEVIELAAQVGYEAGRGLSLGLGEVDVPTWRVATKLVKERHRMAAENFLLCPAGSAEKIYEAHRMVLGPKELPAWSEKKPAGRKAWELMRAVAGVFRAEWELTADSADNTDGKGS